MIGHIARACEDGRRDARAGRRRPWRELTRATLRYYMDGWRREHAAMAREGRLAQLEMDLNQALGGATLLAVGGTDGGSLAGKADETGA